MPDKPRLCTLIVGPLTSECDRVHCMDAAAIQVESFNCHCHFSGSPNFDSLTVSYSKTQSLQPYTKVFLIDFSNLPGRPKAGS